MRALLLVVLLLAIAAATLGFVTDRARAQPLVATPADASSEAILPPIMPRPDGGLVPDAGKPMAPERPSAPIPNRPPPGAPIPNQPAPGAPPPPGR